MKMSFNAQKRYNKFSRLLKAMIVYVVWLERDKKEDPEVEAFKCLYSLRSQNPISRDFLSSSSQS